MLTLTEAAAYMAAKMGRETFPQATIRSWIFHGKLKAVKVGGKRYVKESDLDIFLPAKKTR